ncbi:MAG: hypothetical protein HS101_09585 [Planctomycetia bacterium]|nr:hypothetical protein [Planctomycetia bacterium]MCC7316818.1 hypothetical protein [Planctomycetota bacterium]
MQARSTGVRWHHAAVAAIVVLLAAASRAPAQLQPIGSFLDMPDSVFYNIWNSSACGAHYWTPFTIDVGGNQVTVTTLGSSPPPGYEDGPYYIGCFDWSSPGFDFFRLPRDPAVDPGDYIGNYNSPLDTAHGDLILNFSEPLTSFGFSSWVGRPCSSRYNPGDTALLYDGLGATGNLLGSVSTSTTATSCYFTIDFVGLVGETPQIRSVRIPLDSPGGIFIDGIAVSLGPQGLLGDLNCDGAVNTFDIDPFALALIDPAGYAAAYPNCDRLLADCGQDGNINGLDTDSFVICITNGGCP